MFIDHIQKKSSIIPIEPVFGMKRFNMIKSGGENTNTCNQNKTTQLVLTMQKLFHSKCRSIILSALFLIFLLIFLCMCLIRLRKYPHHSSSPVNQQSKDLYCKHF